MADFAGKRSDFLSRTQNATRQLLDAIGSLHELREEYLSLNYAKGIVDTDLSSFPFAVQDVTALFVLLNQVGALLTATDGATRDGVLATVKAVSDAFYAQTPPTPLYAVLHRLK